MPDKPTARSRSEHAFRRLLAGSTVSMLGSRLTTIAYPLLVLAWHGSAVVAGLAVCAANVPSVLLYVPAGALVDRWPDPRRTLIIAETLRGAAIAVIVCLLVLNWRYIPLVILVAIFEESFEVFSLLAERRYVQALVEPEQKKAQSAQARIEARSHIVVLAGRALGGLLFGMAQSLPFAFDFFSFGFSVLTVASVTSDETGTGSSARAARPSFPRFWSRRGGSPNRPPLFPRIPDLWEEMRVGGSVLFKDAFAFRGSLISAGTTLVSQALIIVFLASAHDKHVSSFVIGSVLAASGFGGLFGAAISQLSPRPWNKSPLKYQPLVWTFMLILLAAMKGQMDWVMAVVMLVLGLAGAMGNVELDTYLLVNMPKGKFARVTSHELLLDFLAACLGPAFGGLLFVTLGTEFAIIALLLLSVMMALVALYYLEVPDVVFPQVPGPLPEPLVNSLVQLKSEWSKRHRHREPSWHMVAQFSLAIRSYDISHELSGATPVLSIGKDRLALEPSFPEFGEGEGSLELVRRSRSVTAFGPAEGSAMWRQGTKMYQTRYMYRVARSRTRGIAARDKAMAIMVHTFAEPGDRGGKQLDIAVIPLGQFHALKIVQWLDDTLPRPLEFGLGLEESQPQALISLALYQADAGRRRAITKWRPSTRRREIIGDGRRKVLDHDPLAITHGASIHEVSNSILAAQDESEDPAMLSPGSYAAAGLSGTPAPGKES